MDRSMEEFIDDWQINVREKSAQHKSGLKIGYDSTNEDGTLSLTYSGMSTFMKNTFAETQNVEAAEKQCAELTKEFIEIFNAKITPNFSNIQVKPVQHEY